METIGTLKIRSNYNNYIVKYSTVYFYINKKEYNLIKYIYLNRFNKDLINKYNSDQMYIFLNNTGNLIRKNIYYNKDCIYLDLNLGKTINKKDLNFYLSLFNTKDVLVCNDNKIIRKANKDNLFGIVNMIKEGKLYLIRLDSELGDKIRGNKYDIKRYCGILSN
jgi:hypothetical protein